MTVPDRLPNGLPKGPPRRYRFRISRLRPHLRSDAPTMIPEMVSEADSIHAALFRILDSDGSDQRDFDLVFGIGANKHTTEYKLPPEAIEGLSTSYLSLFKDPKDFDRLIEIFKRRDTLTIRRSRFTPLEIPSAESVGEYLMDLTPLQQVVHDNLVDGHSFDSFVMSARNRHRAYCLMYHAEISRGSREHIAMMNTLRDKIYENHRAEQAALAVMRGAVMRDGNLSGNKSTSNQPITERSVNESTCY